MFTATAAMFALPLDAAMSRPAAGSAGVAAGEVSARESPQVVTGSGRGAASGTVSHCPSVGPTAVKRILGISIHGATREEERSKNGGTLRG